MDIAVAIAIAIVIAIAISIAIAIAIAIAVAIAIAIPIAIAVAIAIVAIAIAVAISIVIAIAIAIAPAIPLSQVPVRYVRTDVTRYCTGHYSTLRRSFNSIITGRLCRNHGFGLVSGSGSVSNPRCPRNYIILYKMTRYLSTVMQPVQPTYSKIEMK